MGRKKAFDEGTFVQVSCGEFHTALLTSTGAVYGVGRNLQGQLGLLHVRHRGQLCRMVTWTEQLKDLQIRTVCCVADGTLLLTSTAELFGCGFYLHGQVLDPDAQCMQPEFICDMAQLCGSRDAREWDWALSSFSCSSFFFLHAAVPLSVVEGTARRLSESVGSPSLSPRHRHTQLVL
eukprot:TRINITY_DN23856_c0_g1_i2.p1 TRINITY_DN23856_c0_g1~~TRINITY_DN23856_c0_g1_i2.p1  ORF type:complete len:178 (+),score=25.99 TRINITY_DN23856_c0_g1_i2:161-694(+)